MDPQDVTNLLTLSLGAATVWLGFETRRVALATKESVELQGRPYLAIAGVEIVAGTNIEAPDVPSVRFALCLSNPGQVLVTYEVESIDVDFEGARAINPEFETRGGVVHPKAETKFFYGAIPLALKPRAGQGGVAQFRVNYWSTVNHIEHVEARLRYYFSKADLSATEWIFKSGPTYS